ncbi:hypothetical protein EYF80_020304 [Liparis tanakae]|uniref:Uncharacterized protein n=1 Tax=Liparis tanakae TaxID=230148 RepID=A0A4Z2HV17_9TELE|nr:hypothetical protein EYF80_020304 [Liparis tanakae]
MERSRSERRVESDRDADPSLKHRAERTGGRFGHFAADRLVAAQETVLRDGVVLGSSERPVVVLLGDREREMGVFDFQHGFLFGEMHRLQVPAVHSMVAPPVELRIGGSAPTPVLQVTQGRRRCHRHHTHCDPPH